jgi:pimeloyl-ACP methyl ester carboxylesterase
MTVPQMEQDTFEVVKYLRNRFKREKILVVGHSWGSILGLWLAHEHPETIYAYVGVGQVINVGENDKLAHQEALEQARNLHNEHAIKELESIAPYPPAIADLKKDEIASNWQEQLLGPAPPSLDNVLNLTRVLSAPEYSLLDEMGFFRGQDFSGRILLPEIMKVDLTKLGLEFRAPIFFFEGRKDPYCRPSLIWEYNQAIKAPQKEFVWFENSTHFPFAEEPQKFTDELFQRVLPLAR